VAGLIKASRARVRVRRLVLWVGGNFDIGTVWRGGGLPNLFVVGKKSPSLGREGSFDVGGQKRKGKRGFRRRGGFSAMGLRLTGVIANKNPRMTDKVSNFLKGHRERERRMTIAQYVCQHKGRGKNTGARRNIEIFEKRNGKFRFSFHPFPSLRFCFGERRVEFSSLPPSPIHHTKEAAQFKWGLEANREQSICTLETFVMWPRAFGGVDELPKER